MPLSLAALTTSPGLPGAGGRAYPDSAEQAAKEWADAVQVYAAGIVAPSATVAAARTALEAALLPAFRSTDAAALLEQAFKAFAVTVGGGMAPAFVAVPPPGLIGFAELFKQSPPQSTAEGVARIAIRIDAWMRTGTAAVAMPPGPPVPWS